MKSMVKPLGIGLVTFTVSVICVGRTTPAVTIASALARPAWSAALRPLADVAEPEDVAELEDVVLGLLELHAAAAKATAIASSTPVRNLRENRLRVWSRRVIHPPQAFWWTGAT
jgi:hypothetical protein